jgi:hypothetical protein
MSMKKIITPGVKEVAEQICDVTGRPAVARLVMSFGYGSSRDGDVLEVDLSRETAEDVLAFLQSRYPNFQPQDHLEEMLTRPRCPFSIW